MNRIREYFQGRSLQWFGHLERMEENAWSIKCRNVRVSESFPRGRSRKTWNEVIRSDLKEMKVNDKELAKDRNSRKSFIRNHPTHASMENRL